MKRKLNDLSSLYNLATGLGLIMTIAVLFLTHGSWFGNLFWQDTADTGMDFFHSIEYTHGRVPYEVYGTLYPPLANLLFYVLYRFVPEWQIGAWGEFGPVRGTELDMRLYQSTMVMFILFLIVTAALTMILVQKCLKNYGSEKTTLFSFAILLSNGMLYAYERGNIIVICWLLVLFFVRYRNAENAVLRELAMFALALSAGLKLYPALFGMLLIYDRQYKRAIRAVVYGVACFVLPVFIFREGISGLLIFFKVLMKHSSTGISQANGYDISCIANTLQNMFNSVFGTSLQGSFGVVHNAIGAVLVLLTGFTVKKQWQQVLCCTAAMLLFQSQQGYGPLFLTVPLIALVSEEETISRKNLFPFAVLTLASVMFPIPEVRIWSLRLYDLRNQLWMLLLFGYILAVGGCWVAKKLPQCTKKA